MELTFCIFADGFLNILMLCCEGKTKSIFLLASMKLLVNFGNPSETCNCDFYTENAYRKPPKL